MPESSSEFPSGSDERGDSSDCVANVGPGFVLPNRHRHPAAVFKSTAGTRVTVLVLGELPLPELSVCPRDRQIASRASVPEAAVKEDCDAKSRVDHVRAPRELAPEAIAFRSCAPKGLAKSSF